MPLYPSAGGAVLIGRRMFPGMFPGMFLGMFPGMFQG